MEYWEFLIQKQGERTWVPLLSPTSEIVEGRYRVVARSSRANTDVEVRVIYSTTLEVPPKRRIQKRTRRTNSEGLMVVIPFTNLKPGNWELRCSADLMSDFMGASWQHALQLDVLPKIPQIVTSQPPDTDAMKIASPDTASSKSETPQTEIAPPSPLITPPVVAPMVSFTPPPLAAPPPVAATDIPETTEPTTTVLPSDTSNVEVETAPQLLEVAVNPSDPVANPVWLQGKTAEQILEALLDIALPEEEPLLEPAAEKPATEAIAPVALPPLQLTLDQEIYVAKWGESVTITGVVELAENPEQSENGTQTLATVLGGELLIELRNPQRSQVLALSRQSLPEQLLPFVFTSSVAIPPDCQSKLILADVSFYGRLEGVAEATLLAVESFTITADVSELMEAISQQSLIQELETPETEPEPATIEEELEEVIPIDLEFFHLAKNTKPIAPISLQPTPKLQLPPKLEPRTPAPPEVNPRAPRLPWLPYPEPVPIQNPEATADDKETTAAETGALVPANTEGAIEPQEPIISALDAPEDEDTVEGKEGESTIVPLAPGDRLEVAFESLHLEERFWTRLNALAEAKKALAADNSSEETQQAPLPSAGDSSAVVEGALEETSSQAQQSEVAPNDEQTFVQPGHPPIPPLPLSRHSWKAVDWQAQEVVVDDTPEEPEPKFYKRRPKPQPEQPPVPDLSDLTAKAAVPIVPLPTPELLVQFGELIAGEPLIVQIELPSERSNLAIKLWIEDYQTRSLLDGPHWLFDLIPTGEGSLEGKTQLTVPMGCLEIRIEAIAVDLPTQNESHKASIERKVIPPDLPNFPNLPLDDLLDG
jgi:hypothetical protein